MEECFQKEFLRLKRLPDVFAKFSRLIKPTCSDELVQQPSIFHKRKLWVTYCSSSSPSSPTPVALLSLCPVPGWIAASSSVPSVVTFSGTLMQWDITQLGSSRRATAKARTQPLWIYHANKRPLPRGATQEYIKLQHNSRSLLQVFCPPTLYSHRNKKLWWNLWKCHAPSIKRACFITRKAWVINENFQLWRSRFNNQLKVCF